MLMNPCDLSMSVAALANTIACKLDEEDLSVVAAVFIQLGDTLETILAQREWCRNKCCPDEANSQGVAIHGNVTQP